MRTDSTLSTLLALATAAALAACNATDPITGGDEDEDADEQAEEIASALERENGGLDMEDEAPLFDDENGFASAEIEAEHEYDDAMADDREVQAELGAPGAAIYHATVLWGQMPPDRESELVVDWTGTLSVNRGAILIRRVIAFEDRTDSVDRRRDRRTIRFSSVTRPHVDGFRLTIVDPAPESDEPLVLTYDPDAGEIFSASMAALLEGPQSLEIDDTGNRFVAVAQREPIDVCNHGFVRGRWHRVRDGRGVLYGHVTDAEGGRIGHVRGVYGTRRDGEQVFFGKYIDIEGRFRGLFGGTYGDGDFRGRWMVRDDLEHGILGGEYRERRLTRGIGGHFLGRWAQTSCNLRIDR
jgi:hypothetical protein